MADLLETRREQMFPTLSAAQMMRLMNFGRRTATRAGEVLVEPGDRFGGMLVVVSGALEAVRPSGRVVIAHGGSRTGGLAAEIAAEIADAAILVLDAPIVRVAGIDAPVSAADETKAAPDFDRLVDAIATIAHY